MTGARPRAATLVVELCGLPGAGKSTFARQLVDRARSRGVPVHVAGGGASAGTPRLRRYLVKARLAASVVASSPARQLRSAAACAAAQRVGRDRLAVPLNWWVAQGRVLVARRVTGLAVVDEGPVQASWTATVLASPASRAVVPGRLQGAPSPDVLVLVEIPPELAARRLENRASRHSRLQGLPPPDRASVMQAGEQLLRELVRARSESGTEVVVVTADGFEEAAEALAARADRRTSPC
jgi:thymidylate kinase